MGDRVFAWIEVLWPVDLPEPFDAGAIQAWEDGFTAGSNPELDERFEKVETFLEAWAECVDGCKFESDFSEAGWARLAGAEVNYGTAWFSEQAGIDKACRDLGIPYRYGDEGSIEWGPTFTEWAPGEAVIERPTVYAESEMPALDQSTFEAFVANAEPEAAISAIRQWFKGIDFDKVQRPVLFPELLGTNTSNEKGPR